MYPARKRALSTKNPVRSVRTGERSARRRQSSEQRRNAYQKAQREGLVTSLALRLGR